MTINMIVMIAILKIALLTSISLSNREMIPVTTTGPKSRNVRNTFLSDYDNSNSIACERRNSMCTPTPVDTSDVILPEELFTLAEKIASNIHDARIPGEIPRDRIDGTEKDQGKKLNPALVPYSQLPESEKEYDRKTAMETIRLIVKMGYTITKTGS
ncbi:MAG: RyR domain-containing protein [Eubacteriales bacterium]|nr:RyR domain-containing protein [Eubacteriales bacterium]